MGKKNKKERKPYKLFTLDTETRGLFGEVFRVGLFDGEKYYPSNSFNEIKNVLFNYSINYDCHVFIHNLDFDLSKLAHELIPKAALNDSVFINNNVTVFSTSVTMSQATEENEIISQPITFHDSNKLIMGKLKNICKDFGLDQEKAKIELKDHIINLGWAHDNKNKRIKKDDPDVQTKYNSFHSEGYYFTHVDPWERELNEYLRMDCISLYEVVKTLIEISQLELEEFLKCPTTASLAMKVFQNMYEDDYKKACSTKYLSFQGQTNERFIRDSYCGGRTEVFIPYLKDGYHYDVNSLYPYVMKTYEVPYGKPTMLWREEARMSLKCWLNFRQGAGFAKVDIEIPTDLFIPPLPVKRNDKLIFPVGRITGTWTFEEIEVALKMGCKINEVHQVLYFDKVAFIFKNFIEYFEEIKKNSEGAKKTFSKLMQNSLYGKFGMKRVRKSFLPITQLEKCKERYEEKGLRYIVLDNPLIDGGEFIEAEMESQAAYIQPHIAAYVTSLARIELYKGLISQLEKGSVSYCDTDSVACSEPMADDMIHDKDYGKWKLESVLKEGLFLQPKTYYENEIHEGENGEISYKENKKFKGIPSRIMEDITKDTYFDIFKRLREIQLEIANGKNKFTEDEQFYKLYEAPEKKRVKFGTNMKHPERDKETGEITFDNHIEVTKRLNLINMQKREMDYINNTSKPHYLKEWI